MFYVLYSNQMPEKLDGEQQVLSFGNVTAFSIPERAQAYAHYMEQVHGNKCTILTSIDVKRKLK